MILVIDDNAQERALIRKMLEGDGHEVREAASGDEGLDLAQALRPELIICDLMMPQKDGFETVRDLHARVPGARIVAVSGVLFGTADHATMVERLGLVAVIEKPFRQMQLLDVVCGALGRS
ncbi:MAG TPA: response regulator [Alphaproteobacteria bacterium]|nr:response regulator [Alphaproteobacteria bacterium]